MLPAGFRMTEGGAVELILWLMAAAVGCFVLAKLIDWPLRALNAKIAQQTPERPISPTADDLRRIESDPKGKGAPIHMDDGRRIGSFDILIDYVDAEGEATRRAITVVGFGSGHFAPAFMAYCHLRQAMRLFRVDRIEAVIDDDGEVHEDIPTFFREFGIGQAARAHFRTDVFAVREDRPRRGRKPKS